MALQRPRCRSGSSIGGTCLDMGSGFIKNSNGDTSEYGDTCTKSSKYGDIGAKSPKYGHTRTKFTEHEDLDIRGAMMGYLHAAQTDLAFRFSFDQDLTGYTAVMYYYKEDSGNTSRATVICTVTVVTSVECYVQFIQTTALLTTANTNYIAYVGLKSSGDLERSSNPIVIHVNEEGAIEYSQ